MYRGKMLGLMSLGKKINKGEHGTRKNVKITKTAASPATSGTPAPPHYHHPQLQAEVKDESFSKDAELVPIIDTTLNADYISNHYSIHAEALEQNLLDHDLSETKENEPFFPSYFEPTSFSSIASDSELASADPETLPYSCDPDISIESHFGSGDAKIEEPSLIERERKSDQNSQPNSELDIEFDNRRDSDFEPNESDFENSDSDELDPSIIPSSSKLDPVFVTISSHPTVQQPSTSFSNDLQNLPHCSETSAICSELLPVAIPSTSLSLGSPLLPSSCSQAPAIPSGSSTKVPLQEPNATVSNPSRMVTRKRSRDPDSWKKNINKKLRKMCKPYLSKGDKMLPAKRPKVIICKCPFKCTSVFSDAIRDLLCEEFHAMEFIRQKDYLLQSVLECTIERKRAAPGSKKEKQCGRKYHLMNDNKKLRVCKKFFLNTLCISHGPVDSAMKHKNEVGLFGQVDRRGKKPPKNKTIPEMVARVKTHIEGFPTVESHYCRMESKKKYLDANLSITKMYYLYKEECNEGNLPSVSAKVYRKIFCEEFNLSFFKPKKDQCLLCTNYQKASAEKKREMQKDLDDHVERKKSANAEKQKDKEIAAADPSFVTATFDLQSVLQVPSSDVSQLYYSRKLNAYNLSIYEGAPPNNAYCYCWSEINGMRGSSEIGTALFKWMKTLPEHVTKISLFSDCCGGQNRNKHVASLMLYAVNTLPNIHVIEHKFLESGHTHMECDSMHSAIESAKKNVPVYSLQDWFTIMRLARSNRKNKESGPYKVIELKYDDFFDLKKLSMNLLNNKGIDTEGRKVSWLKIKRLKFLKSETDLIFYSNSFEGEYYSINIVGKKKKKTSAGLESLYKKQLPITQAKKEDLLKLCRTGVIPEEYHGWFAGLPSAAKTRDRAPEPSFSENEEY